MFKTNSLSNVNKIKNSIQFLEKLKKENRIKDYKIQKKTGEKKEKTVCCVPFNIFDINPSGIVYTCCADFIKHNSIGNIFENNLDEIWNSEKAQEIRRKILNSDYSICDLDTCTQRCTAPASVFNTKCAPPRCIVISYNKECNLNCLTCRDKKYINTPEENNKFEEMVYSRVFPFLKDIDIVEISAGGEAFYSKHSRDFIKKAAQTYPHIKWKIYSNGVLFTQENCRMLGIYGKINEVLISLPALNRELYNKIMRGSDYDTVMKNIKSAVYEYKHNKSIKMTALNTVVSALNYKEIPALAKFAKKNDITIIFSRYKYWGTEFGRDYKSVSVWDKEHPEYESFKKILKHPNLNYERVYMAPLFNRIRMMD